MPEKDALLSATEKQQLLLIAREAITAVAGGCQPQELQMENMPPNLRENGASFVTLTVHNCLRGCIGALEACQPLALDVQEHAVAAATQDFRFSPLQEKELSSTRIEISCLTPFQPLLYHDPQELPELIRPGVHGVILSDGFRHATFLPQVWEKLPSPQDFLSHLCMKMGASPDLWRKKKLNVYVYTVEEFEEEE